MCIYCSKVKFCCKPCVGYAITDEESFAVKLSGLEATGHAGHVPECLPGPPGIPGPRVPAEVSCNSQGLEDSLVISTFSIPSNLM